MSKQASEHPSGAEQARGTNNEQSLVTKVLGWTTRITQVKMRVKNLATSGLGEFSE